MELGSWHELARERLIAAAEFDAVSGEYVLCVSDARRVLGSRLHIPRTQQVVVLRELRRVGVVRLLGRRHVCVARVVARE